MFGAFVPPTDYILSFIRGVCARFSANTKSPQLSTQKKERPYRALNAAYIPRLSAPLQDNRASLYNLRRWGMSPRLLPQLDHSNFFRFFPLLALISTIHMFFRWQQTIFPHTFSPQLFRWLYILNVFPCVKNNFSIHIFSTTSRVIYPSRFSVCVFCVLIFHRA